jgi:hypothetical protein
VAGAVRAGASFTAKTSTSTLAMAGSAASANTSRTSFRARSTAEASSGPTTAPAWSIARWKPNARPRSAGGVTSATRASRGAPRTPLPMRSATRTASTCQGAVASATSGRASEESV